MPSFLRVLRTSETRRWGLTGKEGSSKYSVRWASAAALMTAKREKSQWV